MSDANDEKAEPFHFSHAGWCPICEKQTVFRADRPQFRDHLKCERCGSIPRQRALVHVMSQFFPNWRDAVVHEAGPSPWMAVARKFRKECKQYAESQYVPDHPLGTLLPAWKWDSPNGTRNENLECQSFEEAVFDIVITQDVLEHIFHPDLAIAEIARTLKPGGMKFCSVPITQRHRPSRRRASIANGEIVHHHPAVYHANPSDKSGSLVTIDWGFDISAYLSQKSGMSATIVQIDNIELGIRADLIEIVVFRKDAVPLLNA